MKSRAFTLIELLVVVLIIGILSAIALPQYQKVVSRTKYTQLKIMAQSIAEAEEVYYLANGSYTDDFDQLDTVPPNASGNLAEFSEFWCMLFDVDGRVTCYMNINSIETGYTYYLQHGLHPNIRTCFAYSTDGNSLNNQICRAETQATSPDDEMGNGRNLVWVYQ